MKLEPKGKVIVVGVDGMDARLCKKFLDEGKMPNVKKLLEHGAAREDLVMLGALPTITPPQWTTLATGAYPGTHGITDFWNQHPTKLDTLVYSLDSRQCKAEQLWNVTAEAGLNTLVWHWPGSSWPPTSDSPNLSVVEGTQPTNVNLVVGNVEWEQYIVAQEDVEEEVLFEEEKHSDGTGCIISDVEVADEDSSKRGNAMDTMGASELHAILLSEHEGEKAGTERLKAGEKKTMIGLRPARKWQHDIPEDAKEFSIPVNYGKERRPALFLKNDKGEYGRVEIYKNKRAAEPLVVLEDHSVHSGILDTLTRDGEQVPVSRQYVLVNADPKGTSVTVYVGNAVKIGCDDLFHPKSLYHEVHEAIGEIPSICLTVGATPDLCEKVTAPLWHIYGQWQADCINHLIETHDYDVVFSHFHNVDCFGHVYWERATYRDEFHNDPEDFMKIMERCYVDTDDYIGQFLHLLDKGWTIVVTSDHGLVDAREDMPPALGDPFGVNTKAMVEMGYTALKKDENGEPLREIDWEHTRAIAPRGNYIYINLKGKYETGIVDPEDKYALEDQIISDLYKYEYNGKRCVALALREQDAALLGLKGDGCGDIVYFLSEGFNRVHGDSLSTYQGEASTSESPLFMIGGRGVKHGVYTNRVIRQVDVAPTLAVIAGVRMPAQCEGAPVYQILDV
ncbi:MAG: alkaline phosphatase family protein [Peptococcaceae bacterium]|nr:alkaline phosphatase family protein [Peptococcaceae bacterium]